jgi:two-component system sensor histidine kinase VicK
MRVHFFTRIDPPNRSSFRGYCTQQNLRTVKILSLIYFLVSVSLRLIVVINDLPIQNISHIDEFNQSNWIAIAISPLFYISSLLLLKYFDFTTKTQFVVRVFVLLFALFMMISFMRGSFFTMYNPRNTLVLYLMGLIMASVFFTFEYFETIFLAMVTGIYFTIMIPFYQHSFGELVMNNLASLVLLVMFFCISRYSFSYRADNYLKIKAIEQKNKEVEDAIRVKNEILGIVAHDLRNPLSAIKTVTMLMEMDALDEESRENIQMIKVSCDKAASIINDLLETAHNEKLNEFDIEKIELNQFLLRIVDEWVKGKMGQINILYYGFDKPVYSRINTEKMERVMDNLISNAIKFSGPSNHIEISLHATDREVLIDVKDFGMGIPEKLLPYIFDRFSRASRKGIRGEESVGLGLSIVRQIVQKHGGEIEVHSTEKRGTTFTISLGRVPA